MERKISITQSPIGAKGGNVQDRTSGSLFYKRVRHFNVAGHIHFLTFSCYQRLPLLTHDLWRTWLAEAIRKACAKHSYALWAYVFMPDHVHLLVKPRRETYDISTYLKSVKLGVAKRILARMQLEGWPLLDDLRVSTGSAVEERRFWQAGPGHDKNIWSLPMAVEKAQYCHRNPVLRRLVESPDQWRWSSFRWLELGHREDEPLAVDDWDERLEEG
jgi:putative transposase